MLEAAKISCGQKVALASLSIEFAKESISIEKNVTPAGTSEDGSSLDSITSSQVETA